MNACKYELVAATEINNGDVVHCEGYRCRVSQATSYTTDKGVVVRRFVLTSEPNAAFPQSLPGCFDGAWYGGNEWARYGREVAAN